MSCACRVLVGVTAAVVLQACLAARGERRLEPQATLRQPSTNGVGSFSRPRFLSRRWRRELPEAINVAPGVKDVERAMTLAQERPDARERFHSPYIVRLLDNATVEAIDVVTEFRRYVQTAEKELSLGHWLFAQGTRDAQAAVQPWRGQLSMVARIRFHPQNVLTSVPSYVITMGRPDLAPKDVIRTPIAAPPSGRRRDVSTPLVGATIEALFDAAPVGQTVRPVMVSLAGQEVARVTIDFARLE